MKRSNHARDPQRVSSAPQRRAAGNFPHAPPRRHAPERKLITITVPNRRPAPVGHHAAVQYRHRGSRRRPFARVAAVALATIVTLTTVAAALTHVPPSNRITPAERARTTGLIVAPTRPSPVDASPTAPASTSPDPAFAPNRTPSPPVAPAPVPERGTARFAVAAAADRAPQSGSFTYTVEVERDLPFPAISVAGVVDDTLADSRGWRHEGVRLSRVEGDSDIRILLATPATTDALCAPLRTRGRVSCRNGANVVLNAWRWAHGTSGYRDDLAGYRRYMVNHEVGHALGHPHTPCPRPGALAPVMLQQTLGLDGCRPNPWPRPAAKGTQ